MSFQNFEAASFCVGGRHISTTTKNVGDIIFKGNKVLIGHCSNCTRTIYMTVSDSAIVAEDLGDFFTNLSKKGLMLPNG